MTGLMMDFPLTISAIVRRAEALHGRKEIVSRLVDGTFHRYTYRDMIARARKLAVALGKLGVQPGDRIATLCWNHYPHLEAYIGVTSCGAVVHTLNPRLHHDDLAYIAGDAADSVLLVDACLFPLWEKFRDRVRMRGVIVVSVDGATPTGMLGYEDLLASANEAHFVEPTLREDDAAAMCYTSGTTGRPKGVVYSHRAIVLQSMALGMVDTFGIGEADVVLPLAPMFHVNAWNIPFVCTLLGAKQVYLGPHLEPATLADVLARERVTVTCGVPTIWLGLLQHLDKHPKVYDLSHLRLLITGGSAAPISMIRSFQERHGLKVVQAWGMTEMTPMGSVANLPSDLRDAPMEEQYTVRARQGPAVPLVEMRARGADGLVPWDGKTVGELEVRGPWVAREYYHCAEGAARFTTDGWFRTGDIVTIDARGWIEIHDRAKDVIKSGGEWISSVALENALMGHPAVAEAAVVAVPHPKWQERPLATVVLKEGCTASASELTCYLEQRFTKWWLPDAIVFIAEIPRTTSGKFLKRALRDQFRDYLSQD